MYSLKIPASFSADPGTFSSISVTPTYSKINAITSYVFIFTLNDQVQANGK